MPVKKNSLAGTSVNSTGLNQVGISDLEQGERRRDL